MADAFPREVLGEATFSCLITLAVGAPFTLKISEEIFKITAADANTHKAQKIGKTERTPKAIFPKCQHGENLP